MKKLSKFAAVLIAVVLCLTLSVPAFADSLNPEIKVERTENVITVTVEDSKVISDNVPTLAIPADNSFDGAKVFYGSTAASTYYADGKVYFKLTKGGTYHIVAEPAFTANGNSYTYGGSTYTETPRTVATGEMGLEFRNEIRLTVSVQLDGFEKEVAAKNVGLLVWTGEGEPTENAMVFGGANVEAQNGAEVINGMYVVHTGDIPVKELGDTCYMRPYVDFGGIYVYGNMISSSPEAVAMTQINAEDTDSELKAALVALLDYSAAAQTYFGYKADDLVNAGITAERSDYANAMLESLDSVSSALAVDWERDTKNCPKIFASLVLNNVVTLNFRAKFSDKIMAEEQPATFMFWSEADYAKMVADGITFAASSPTMTVDAVLTNDGYYMGGYSVAADELGDTIYVCAEVTVDGIIYRSGVVAYSTHTYVKDRLSNSKNENMKNLVKALTVFGEAAEVYFGK